MKTRCIDSRLYRVEIVVGYTLVRIQPPRHKKIKIEVMKIYSVKALMVMHPDLSGEIRIVTGWPNNGDEAN